MTLDGSVADSSTATDESEIIHTSTQFVHLIAQQKAYVLQNKLPLGTLDALNTEQFVLASKLKDCRKQTNLLPFLTIDLLATSLNK